VNNDYTQERKHELMRLYISEHYHDLQCLAKSVARNQHWEDLLHETVISLLSAKTYPDDIFIREREFLYIYSAMHKLYYQKGTELLKKYVINDTFSKVEPLDEVYDFKNEVIYKCVYDFINQEEKNGKLSYYQANIFRMVYFPEFIKDHLNIKEENYILLNKKSSYRNIQKVTDINYQSVRYTTLEVLEYVKKNMKLENEPIHNLNDKIEFKPRYTKWKNVRYHLIHH